MVRNDVACFHDEAVAVRGKKCEARIGLAVRHVAVFEAKNPRANAIEINRANDWPVVTFGIDLNHIDLREASGAQRAFDGVTRHG